MDVKQAAERFCRLVVAHPDMPNAAAKLGSWMIGVAANAGGFPVALSLREIQRGTGSRIETIKSSIEWLENKQVLSYEDGTQHIGFGHHARLYSFKL